MGIDREVLAAARGTAAETGVAARVLLALAIAETNAVAFAAVEGRREPLIRFEGHHFDRRLGRAERDAARAAGLSDPRAGAIRNPASQAGRWRLLAAAMRIDEAAAIESASWGLGQVMGGHWKRLGFASPLALAEAARGSAAGQFRLIAGFLRLGGLDRLLAGGDYAGFARAYNGPAYRQNRYDAKIKAALAAADRALAGAAEPAPPAGGAAGGLRKLAGRLFGARAAGADGSGADGADRARREG